MYNQLCSLGRQSRGMMTFGLQWAIASWKQITCIPWGFSNASVNAAQCLSSIWPALQPPRVLVYLQIHYTDHLQYYLLANIPTPTLQKNMHLISYAECSLKIVILWCKVRTKLDRLSLAHSRWFFVFKAPSVFPALQKHSFARISQYMPTEWVSDRKTERGGGFLSWFERLIGCHKKKLYHIVLISLYFLRASVQLSNACHYLTVIWPVWVW